MNVSSLVALAALLSLTAIACAPQAAPPPVASNVVATSAPLPAPPRPPVSHAYRFDFVLTVADGAAPPTTSSFTMNLVEHSGGEITVGKNVALNPQAGPGAAPAPRQDVGLKVKASLKNVGDDLYLETQLELSAFEPPTTVRKVVQHGDVLAIEGKPSLVTSLDDDKKHYQLTVTPTKLR